MKILFLNFWARYTGGAEYSLIDIISKVAPDHQTELIASETGPLTEAAQKAGCTCRIFPCNVNVALLRRKGLLFSGLTHVSIVLDFLKYCKTVFAYIREFDPDRIHSNVPKSHIMLFLLILSGFNRKAYVHIREIFTRQSLPFYLYALLFNPKNTSVIAISNEVYRSLPAKLKRKTEIIYNGVTIPTDKMVLKKPAYPPRFLYLGRVVPWKGCELLIDAFNLLYKKYGTNAGTLSIVGGTFYWDTGYRIHLQNKITALHLTGRISICDHTTDITAQFLKNTIFCLPSNQEPFGRVAAEAMAHGLPVIGFRSGGLPEVVETNVTGILSETRSAFSLFAIMCQCVEKPDQLFTMGMNGRKRCIERFNKDIQIERIVSFVTG